MQKSNREKPVKNRRLGIAFAGGGTKSFYQLGLMSRWREMLLPKIGVVAACSAGSFMSVLLLSERENAVKQYWYQKYSGKLKNFDWQRLFKGQKPIQHEFVYRDLLLHALADGGFEKIRTQSFPVLFLTTAFPLWMPSFLMLFLGLLTYKLGNFVHKGNSESTYSRLTGVMPMAFDARKCASPHELCDLVIASSATPPFTTIGKFGGKRLLDGGVIDYVPNFLLNERSNITHQLVLLTGQITDQPPQDTTKRFLVRPSKPLNIRTWDFSRPDLIDATISQGEEDADFYYPQLTEFLYEME